MECFYKLTVWTLLKNLGFLGLYLSDQRNDWVVKGTSTLNWASSSFIPSLAFFSNSDSASSCNTQTTKIRFRHTRLQHPYKILLLASWQWKQNINIFKHYVLFCENYMKLNFHQWRMQILIMYNLIYGPTLTWPEVLTCSRANSNFFISSATSYTTVSISSSFVCNNLGE